MIKVTKRANSNFQTQPEVLRLKWLILRLKKKKDWVKEWETLSNQVLLSTNLKRREKRESLRKNRNKELLPLKKLKNLTKKLSDNSNFTPTKWKKEWNQKTSKSPLQEKFWKERLFPRKSWKTTKEEAIGKWLTRRRQWLLRKINLMIVIHIEDIK